MPARNIIAVYTRVSTGEQTEASQRREIEAYLEREGFDPSRVRWFSDKSTGDNFDRPGFAELDRLIDNGAVRTVIVWKLDRLSRKMVDGMRVLSRWLEDGIRFVSVTQDFDFRATIGAMVASMLLGFAQLEQESRKARQAAGIAAARERGVYGGRKPGTTKGKPERAKELKAKGLTRAEIAASMDTSTRTVTRYLAMG